MITLKEFLEIVGHRITEGSEYGWHCFGPMAYTLDSWNGDNVNGHSLHIIFDTRTQVVYQIEAHDFNHARAYSYTNPDFKAMYDAEVTSHGGDTDYEDYKMTELDDLNDWIEKATAIVAGKDYDTRVTIPLDFSDAELYEMMKMAHSMDLSLNKFVEHILGHVIDKAKECK